MRDELRRTAERLALELDGGALDRLDRLAALWRSHARAINLTGARTDDALREHIEDGLAVVACATKLRPEFGACDWLDVGSGGGFPSLIVAAVTSARLVLVEPRLRRAAFLEFALAAIGNNSVVARCRLGDATWDKNLAEQVRKRGSALFGVASSRAVFAPDAWIALGDNLVFEGGFLLVHRRPGGEVRGGRAADAVVELAHTRIEAFVRGGGG